MIRYSKINKKSIMEKISGADKVFHTYADNIISAYLFGSMKSGNNSPLSDIDIAVLFNQGLPGKEFRSYENKLYVNLLQYFKTDEIDLIILNDIPLSFQYEVVKDKRILYYSDFVKMIDFENRVILEYLDFKPYRDEYNKAFIEAMV